MKNRFLRTHQHWWISLLFSDRRFAGTEVRSHIDGNGNDLSSGRQTQIRTKWKQFGFE
jgi:hypothetical protein